MAGLPLEGIRVLGITVVWAGPFAETILADWGAEVIRVENIQFLPSSTRGPMAHPPEIVIKNMSGLSSYAGNIAGERPWNRYSLFNAHGRNKLGCTIDITRPKGVELFKQLVAKSDAFVENNAFGAMERLGLGWEDLREINPRLVMVSMPGYGNTGPYKWAKGFGLHMEATCGHTWLRGYRDLDPSNRKMVFHADAVAGANAAYAIMLALLQRERTGKGQFIDFAQTEGALCHQFDAVLDYTMNGRVRGTMGNRQGSSAPCGVYACSGEDEWVAITVFDDEDWTGFCRAIGNPAWTRDEAFSTSVSRFNNQDTLDKLVEEWTKGHRNYEVMYALQKEGVAAGPVLSDKDVLDDPHLNEREHLVKLYQEDSGEYRTPGINWRSMENPNHIRRPAVRLGEHNEYVYKQIIGVSDEEYAELEKDGHIGMDYAPTVK